MRASVVWWSAVSGTVLGLFVDATLIGVALLLSTILPGMSAREYPRWISAVAIAALTSVMVVMTLLGYLEGRLKAV
jgi:hypothetical protein